MGSQVAPYLMLEFCQIYSVRTLEQGEHERVRVKPIDAKRVIQLAYEEGSVRARFHPSDDSVSVTGNVEIRQDHCHLKISYVYGTCCLCNFVRVVFFVLHNTP